MFTFAFVNLIQFRQKSAADPHSGVQSHSKEELMGAVGSLDGGVKKAASDLVQKALAARPGSASAGPASAKVEAAAPAGIHATVL